MIVAGGGRFRGIRFIASTDPDQAQWGATAVRPEGLLLDGRVREGFAQLAPLGLSFDAWVYHTQLGDVLDLARAFPGTPIVLNHVGGPIGLGRYKGKRDAVFADWSASIRDLAACPNVHVKLGGLGMRLLGFDLHEGELPPSSEQLADGVAALHRDLHHGIRRRPRHVRKQFPGRQGLLRLRRVLERLQATGPGRECGRKGQPVPRHGVAGLSAERLSDTHRTSRGTGVAASPARPVLEEYPVSSANRPKVAFIGTGGTISSLGIHPLELQDYGVHNNRMHAGQIVARFPVVNEIAEVIPVDFKNVPSPEIYFPEWRELAALCHRLVADHPDLAGIVIGHGTATLEETAWVLNLVLKVAVPVVLIGAQRPASGLSTDAAINLLNGVRTAASPDSRGRGVLVLLNDEIQAAREVTKTSNWRMQTFRTPDFGILGHADADRIAYYRRPERRHMPDTEFDIAGLDALPRVDIAYAYAGSDGSAMRAFIAAGARGLVSAGFAPGMPPAADLAAMTEAVRQGIVVVQSSRAGSGRIHRSKKLADAGVLAADNLNPQKARLLLALALTRTSDPAEIARIFATY